MQVPESRLFSFRSEFHESVLAVLARSRHTLAFSGNDFSDWPLESAEAFEHLSRLLRQAGSSLRLVVHSPDWLDRRGVRFRHLRTTFAGRLECRQAPPEIAPGECLLIGDGMHLLRRAHYQAFRGRLQLGMPQEAEPWRRKYDLLWKQSAPCLPPSTTGL